MQFLPALALAAPLLGPVTVGDPAPVSEPIAIGERFEFSSKLLEESLTVDVHLPPTYEDSFGKHPVLFVFDPEYHFAHVVATADHLARARALPPLIVVGVHSGERRRDLTPTHLREVPKSGGADRFLEFLGDELTPWLDARYRTAPYRIAFGQSNSALFSVYALARRPDVVQAAIAVEPKLRWDEGVVLSALEEALADRKSWRGNLHLARAGERVKSDPYLDRAVALSNGPLPEQFELTVRVHADESPSTVALSAAREGLRALYRGWPSEPVTYQTELPVLTQQYADLSKRFGYEIPVPEQDLNMLGYRLLFLDQVDEAVAVFERNVATWPQSANVYDSLGDALVRAGKPEQALDNYEEACRRAEAQHSSLLDVYVRNRDRLREELERTP